MTPRKTRSTSAPYASRLPRPIISLPCPRPRSRLSEENLADVGLGPGPRVVRVDADRDRLDLFVRLLAVDLPVVLANVPLLGDPLAEIILAGAHDDVRDEARLLALDGDAGRRGRVPDVADDPGADGRGKAGEGDVELGGLVVALLFSRVAAAWQLHHLPAPLNDLVVLAVDLDFLVDGRAVPVADHVERAVGARVHDLELVLGASPVLAAPARRHARLAHGALRPVLDDQLGALAGDGRGRREQQEDQDRAEPQPGRVCASGELVASLDLLDLRLPRHAGSISVRGMSGSLASIAQGLC